jgi:hypothetical protein
LSLPTLHIARFDRTTSVHRMHRAGLTVEYTHPSVLLPLLCALASCGGGPEPTRLEVTTGNVSTVRTASALTAQATTLKPATAQLGPVTGTASPTGAAQRGVLLAGLPGENAYSVLQSYVADDGQPTAAHPAVPAVVRPVPLKATLHLAATVGQVNAALNAVGGRIVAMNPGRKSLTVELTSEGLGGKLLSNQEAAAKLLSSRAFQWIQGPGLPVLPEATTADPAVSEPADDLGSRS